MLLQNNGQFCIAGAYFWCNSATVTHVRSNHFMLSTISAKRIYIHDSVYEKVRDELVSYARDVVVGDGAREGTQLGPVQNKRL